MKNHQKLQNRHSTSWYFWCSCSTWRPDAWRVSDHGGPTLHRRYLTVDGITIDLHFRIAQYLVGSPAFTYLIPFSFIKLNYDIFVEKKLMVPSALGNKLWSHPIRVVRLRTCLVPWLLRWVTLKLWCCCKIAIQSIGFASRYF